MKPIVPTVAAGRLRMMAEASAQERARAGVVEVREVECVSLSMELRHSLKQAAIARPCT